jgi:hypothetical protein
VSVSCAWRKGVGGWWTCLDDAPVLGRVVAAIVGLKHVDVDELQQRIGLLLARANRS